MLKTNWLILLLICLYIAGIGGGGWRADAGTGDSERDEKAETPQKPENSRSFGEFLLISTTIERWDLLSPSPLLCSPIRLWMLFPRLHKPACCIYIWSFLFTFPVRLRKKWYDCSLVSVRHDNKNKLMIGAGIFPFPCPPKKSISICKLNSFFPLRSLDLDAVLLIILLCSLVCNEFSIRTLDRFILLLCLRMHLLYRRSFFHGKSSECFLRIACVAVLSQFRKCKRRTVQYSHW